MSKETYTPGPWVADFHGHIMAHGGTTNVASTWTTPDTNYPNGRPYQANARLIAASPKLLAALRTVVEMEYDRDEESRNFDDERLKEWADLIAAVDGRAV